MGAAPAVARSFFKLPTMQHNATDSVCHYWLDGNVDDIRTLTLAQGGALLDMGQLSEGFHHIYFRMGAAPAVARSFFKLPTMQHNATDSLCHYWLDDNVGDIRTLPLSQGAALLDMSQLSEGFHHIYFRVGDAPTMARAFFKLPALQHTATDSLCHYWLDDNVGDIRTLPVSQGAALLDMSQLSEGFHHIYFRVGDAPTMARAFFKLPVAGITRYEYWLNNDSSTMKTVTVNPTANPFALIAELDMPRYRLRPEQYAFAVENGLPKVYPINHATFRFYNHLDNTVDTTATYIDVSSGEAVSPLRQLHPSEALTTQRPDTEDILWYSMNVTANDSILLKANHNCTLQLYSPTSELLYEAVGDSSQVFGGVMPTMDGTYYLALHSTGQKDRTITVTALFSEPIPPAQLTIRARGNGTVSYAEKDIRDDEASFEIDGGSTAKIVILPDRHHHIDTLLVNGEDRLFAMANDTLTIDSINDSTSVKVVFAPQYVETPAITANMADSTITMGCPTEGAVIHYTLDGNEPDTYSSVYTGPTRLYRNCTVKAIAVRENWYPSQVATLRVDWFKVEDVELVQEGNIVSLFTVTDSATIHYTLYNSVEEQTYRGPLAMTSDCTIKAWATRDGYNASDTTRYDFVYTPQGEATFDGLVATVSGNRTLDEAFAQVGGRSEAAKTIAAIVWNKTEPLAAEDLQGIDNPNLLVYVSEAAWAPQGTQNVVVNNVCDRLVLVDRKAGDETQNLNNGFHAPLPFTARRAEYTHHYSLETPTKGCKGWETLVLPFDVQKVEHRTRGELVPFAAWEGNEQRKPFWLYVQGSDRLERAREINAYLPHLIAMPNNPVYDEDYCLAGNVTFSARNVTIAATPLQESITGNTLLPTLLPIEQAQTVGALNLGGEGGFDAGSVFLPNSRRVQPFQCYVTTTIGGQAPMLFIDELLDETTDVQGILHLSGSDESQEQKTFDLGGRRVKNTGTKTSANRLNNGIIVESGKKRLSH